MTAPDPPIRNASGCAAIVFAPFSNARCVLAMYSSRLGAARSVLTEIRLADIVTPCEERVERVLSVLALREVERVMARSGSC
jgi:hypothetical protein